MKIKSRKNLISILSVFCALCVIMSVITVTNASAEMEQKDWSVKKTVWGYAYSDSQGSYYNPSQVTAKIINKDEEAGTTFTTQNLNIATPQSTLANYGDLTGDHTIKYTFDLKLFSADLSAKNGVFIGISIDDLIQDNGKYPNSTSGRTTMLTLNSGMGFKIDVKNQKIGFYIPRESKNNGQGFWTIKNNWGAPLGELLDFSLDTTHRFTIEQDGWAKGDGKITDGKKITVTIDGSLLYSYILYEDDYENCDEAIYKGLELNLGVGVMCNDTGNSPERNTGEYAKVCVNLAPTSSKDRLEKLINDCINLYNNTESASNPTDGQVSVAAKADFKTAIETAQGCTGTDADFENAFTALKVEKQIFNDSIVDSQDVKPTLTEPEWKIVKTIRGYAYEGLTAGINTEFLGEEGTKIVTKNTDLANVQSVLSNSGTSKNIEYTFDLTVNREDLDATYIYIGMKSEDNIVIDNGRSGIRQMSSGLGFRIDVASKQIGYYLPRSYAGMENEFWQNRDTWKNNLLGSKISFTFGELHHFVIKQEGWSNDGNHIYKGKRFIVYMDGTILADYVIYEDGSATADSSLYNGENQYICFGVDWCEPEDNTMSAIVDLTSDPSDVALAKLLNECKNLLNSTPSSDNPKIGETSKVDKAIFEKAIQKAENDAKNAQTELEYSVIVNTLRAAKSEFNYSILKLVDKENLKNVIAQAKTAMNDFGQTAIGYADLSSLVSKAEALVKKSTATQKQVDQMIDDLNDAINALSMPEEDFSNGFMFDEDDEPDLVFGSSADEEDEEFETDEEYFDDDEDYDDFEFDDEEYDEEEDDSSNGRYVRVKKKANKTSAETDNTLLYIILGIVGAVVLIGGEVVIYIVLLKKKLKSITK